MRRPNSGKNTRVIMRGRMYQYYQPALQRFTHPHCHPAPAWCLAGEGPLLFPGARAERDKDSGFVAPKGRDTKGQASGLGERRAECSLEGKPCKGEIPVTQAVRKKCVPRHFRAWESRGNLPTQDVVPPRGMRYVAPLGLTSSKWPKASLNAVHSRPALRNHSNKGNRL